MPVSPFAYLASSLRRLVLKEVGKRRNDCLSSTTMQVSGYDFDLEIDAEATMVRRNVPSRRPGNPKLLVTILVRAGRQPRRTGRKIMPCGRLDLHREQMLIYRDSRDGALAAPAGLPDDTNAPMWRLSGSTVRRIPLRRRPSPGAAGGCGRISGRQLRADLSSRMPAAGSAGRCKIRRSSGNARSIGVDDGGTDAPRWRSRSSPRHSRRDVRLHRLRDLPHGGSGGGPRTARKERYAGFRGRDRLPRLPPVYPSALRLLCNTAVETRTALEAFGHAG